MFRGPLYPQSNTRVADALVANGVGSAQYHKIVMNVDILLRVWYKMNATQKKYGSNLSEAARKGLACFLYPSTRDRQADEPNYKIATFFEFPEMISKCVSYVFLVVWQP